MSFGTCDFSATLVPQEDLYRITPSASPEWALFEIARCGSCWDSLESTILPGTTEELVLPPGRYYALFARRTREPAEIGLQLEPR